MARNAHDSEARLRLDTRLTTASQPTSQQDNDYKVAIVSPQAPQLEEVVEGEILELCTDDVDTLADVQTEAASVVSTLPNTLPSPDSALLVRSRTRAHSESDRAQFDRVTGQSISRYQNPANPQIYRPGQARYPLLQATVEELAHETAAKPVHDGERTNGTSSPARAPGTIPIRGSVDPAEHGVLSPLDASSPVSFPTDSDSGALSGAQDVVRRSISGLVTQRAFNSRRTSRRSSARSNQLSMSPASAFLSQWSSSHATPEQDDSGQQIGDQGEYTIGQQIGFGGFSIIKEVFKIEHGHRCRLAVKIVRKQVSGKDALENERFQKEVEHEVSIWRLLKHPNILPLISIFDTLFARYCIMPLTPNGTLLDLIRRFRKAGQTSPGASSSAKLMQTPDKVMPVTLVIKYLYQLARAIQYLHQDIKIVHRDIKLENCLIDDNGNLLLCDFGMAEHIDAGALDSTFERQIPHGSWDYVDDSERDRPHSGMGPSGTSTSITGSLPSASPELIRASSPIYKPSVDMWAYGVICYTLIVGQLPFSHAFAPTLQMMILKGDWDRGAVKLALQARCEDQAAVSAAAALVDGCLEVNAGWRWTITQVMASKFLQH